VTSATDAARTTTLSLTAEQNNSCRRRQLGSLERNNESLASQRDDCGFADSVNDRVVCESKTNNRQKQ